MLKFGNIQAFHYSLIPLAVPSYYFGVEVEVFHSVFSQEIRAGLHTSTPIIVSAGICSIVTEKNDCILPEDRSESTRGTPSWHKKILKHETTSCDAKRLEMLLFKTAGTRTAGTRKTGYRTAI